jgi:hypothetical protein
MNNVPVLDAQRTHGLLSALGEQLMAAGVRYDLAVIGGSALLALGLIERPTVDIDVVAVSQGAELVSADPLPPPLVAARDRVARDFELPERWLNAGPAGLMDFGLPGGFRERVHTRIYGPALTVHFASRVDQVHFKLYAVVDQGSGRHEADLRALHPTPDELLRAARWARQHDPSPGFELVLREVLEAFGVTDADLDV